jgi:hypothetical protein
MYARFREIKCENPKTQADMIEIAESKASDKCKKILKRKHTSSEREKEEKIKRNWQISASEKLSK